MIMTFFGYWLDKEVSDSQASALNFDRNRLGIDVRVHLSGQGWLHRAGRGSTTPAMKTALHLSEGKYIGKTI